MFQCGDLHNTNIVLVPQNKYYDDLAKTAGISNIKPVITKLHNETCQRFLEDLTNFRKDIYRILDDETYIKIQG